MTSNLNGSLSMKSCTKNIDYYSLHGIWGAYASFVLGRIERGAGVVVGDVRPPERGLFVGYRVGAGETYLLPFSSGRKYGLGVASYLSGASSQNIDEHYKKARRFNPEEIERQSTFQAKSGARNL